MGNRHHSDPQHDFVGPSEAPSSLFTLLKRRQFRRMWIITGFSSLGDWLGVFALVFYVQKLTGRPEFAVGGVLLFRVIPGLFFGPFAGVLADRFDRRRLMVTADLARAALIATIPWVHNIWQLYAVSALMEVLSLMWTPSKDATIPNLVERDQLMMANQLAIITTYSTLPLGGALLSLLAIPAGFIAHIPGAPSVFKDGSGTTLALFFDAGTFVFSAMMVARFPAELMRARRAQTADAKWNPFADLREGFRFVRKNKVVRVMVLCAWVAFTGGAAIISLGPIFAGMIVSGSQANKSAAWGALIVAIGIGLVGGMIGAGALARRVKREKIFPIGLIVGGASAVITASMTSIVPAIAATVGAGAGAGIAWVTIFTLLHERTDERLRGRTFATLYTGIQLSLFLGLAGWPFLAGIIGEHTVTTSKHIFDISGARVAMWSGGAFVFVSGLLAARAMRMDVPARKRARMHGLHLSQGFSGGARKGLFIVFEGGEGTGKSTQMKLLHEWLAEQGREVVVTREPGGTEIAERIRKIVLDKQSNGMDPKTEALLFAAGRAQHVAEVIRPALERDAVVLCDRYIDSSIAYQGLGRGLGENDVLSLNVWATDELLPDVVVLLHLEAEQGLERALHRASHDRMEDEDIAFHRKVGDAYLHLAREYPSRFTVVDASGTVEQIHSQIRTTILPFLQEVVAE